ncbi:MAG: thermonuclease family protein [Litorilinea sp.]
MARKKSDYRTGGKPPVPSRRRKAKLPTWAAIALLVLVGWFAYGRVGGDELLRETATISTATVQVSTGPAPVLPRTTPAAVGVPTSEAPGFATVAPADSATVSGAVVIVAPGVPDNAELARVVHIVDGDTIEVEINGARRRVRYLGMDTPEREQPGYLDATHANRALVENQSVYLVREQSDTDVFDRLLRHLYREDGTHVNATLIAQGMAQPVEYRPDVGHAQEFWDLALEAAQARRGFWSGNGGNSAAPDGPMPYGLTVRAVEIRDGPATRFGVNTTAAPTTPLVIFGRTPDGSWLQVRPPSRNGGWVPADAVDARVPIEEIMIAEEIPG